ncbi:phosphoribosyltransferase [Natrialba hulunbeirensis JCM 10989]|uniref:Phosphoribosyltransferase n=1 Tax=Natrialba hulunbeirensis JCM 10989 TaxID=1227493 RepID=M0A3C3_9EURY|nr:phosphoribosyltransferase family protein [Natrialba hulunbeirensis]ELY92367.1 phosphoribosyltransferase [Natrialba hulunbeirensis JCM 10989]
MFTDRTDAGEQLGAHLAAEGIEADVVLGIPRGALPVARPVADELGATLDVVVASKIGAPGNPELALGAVASDGTLWLNDDLVEQLRVGDDYIDRERTREAEAAREKVVQYRDGDGSIPAIDGKRVVVVDDGVATGATAIACLRQVADAGATAVTLAVPVGSPRSLEVLENEAPVDAIVALEQPADFSAVGQYYEDFRQVSDERAQSYLDE